MLPTITVYTFILENKLSDKDLDMYDQKFDSFMRNALCQGFIITNFQDKVPWGK